MEGTAMEAQSDDVTVVGAALPEFATAMRGYDRLQVDEYIGRLDRWLEEATARTGVAESEVQKLRAENAELRRVVSERSGGNGGNGHPALEGMGARLEQMVTSALAECEAMRQRAQEEGDAQVALARQTAVDIVSRARGAVQKLVDEAEELVVEGRQRRTQILEEAEQDRQAVHEDVARLMEQRDRVLASLRAALEGAGE